MPAANAGSVMLTADGGGPEHRPVTTVAKLSLRLTAFFAAFAPSRAITVQYNTVGILCMYFLLCAANWRNKS